VNTPPGPALHRLRNTALPVRPAPLRAALGAAALATVLAGLLVGCSKAPDRAAQAKLQSQALHDACVNAMVSNTCRVMQASGQTLVPPGTTVIFVAGIGPIDAALYSKLRESGEGMCAHLRDICRADWNGDQCRTARTLYGVDAARS
jgi:hypothetical protein